MFVSFIAFASAQGTLPWKPGSCDEIPSDRDLYVRESGHVFQFDMSIL